MNYSSLKGMRRWISIWFIMRTRVRRIIRRRSRNININKDNNKKSITFRMYSIRGNRPK